MPCPPPQRPAGNPLPSSYGAPRVTLLAVNSYLVYAYWDIDIGTLPEPVPPALLRFHDITQGSAGDTFDVNVDLAAGSWYVPMWSPARSYYVQLGWTEGEEFHALATSNTVETPRAWPVNELEPLSPPAAGQTTEPAPPVEETEVVEEQPIETPLPVFVEPDLPTGSTEEIPVETPIGATEALQRRLEEIYTSQRVWSPESIEEPHPPEKNAPESLVPNPAIEAPVVESVPPAPQEISHPVVDDQVAQAEAEQPQPPPDAAGVLRQKLEEIYSVLWVQPQPQYVAEPEPGELLPRDPGRPQDDRPVAPSVAPTLPAHATTLTTPVASISTPGASAPAPPAKRGDLTRQAEERFSPGLFSPFRTAAPSDKSTG